MRHTVYKLFVASSLLVALAAGQSRPKYGGTLRVSFGANLTSLDPADLAQTDSFARNTCTGLLFDTLVWIDNRGLVQPSLATSWESSADLKRWTVHIHSGIAFSDGSALTAESVAASLRTSNPTWSISTQADSVIIESDRPLPILVEQLALPKNAIVKRVASTIVGTGPFGISDWQPGKKLALVANDNGWRGRPFLDGIEIEFGHTTTDRGSALQSGRSDLIEVPAEMSRRAAMAGFTSQSSPNVELVAIVFSKDAQSPDELTRRSALAMSIDRASLHNVLLQGTGDAQSSILPDSMTGYGALFSSQSDLARAKTLRRQAQAPSAWNLRYAANDQLLRLLAERIALNAKDADLTVKSVTEGAADAQLLRIALPTIDPQVDLASIADLTGQVFAPNAGMNIEQLYEAEQKLLAARRMIPLVHLPAVYAARKSLRGWSVGDDGTLRLADAWLETTAP